jgi:hypothetical protein
MYAEGAKIRHDAVDRSFCDAINADPAGKTKYYNLINKGR